MAAAVAAQLRGPSAAAARRWPAPSGGVLRFAPLATSTVPASIARGSLRGVPAGVVLPKVREVSVTSFSPPPPPGSGI